MKRYLIGFIALAWLFVAGPLTAQAGIDWVAYKPGIVKASIAQGGSTFLFYKSTW